MVKLIIGKPFLNCVRSVMLALIVLPALSAVAQDYPVKVVRIVVPFPPGGSTDVLARFVAQKLNELHGQNYIVENRPGATGTIAGAFVAKSAADGYTLIMHSSSSYTAGFLYRKLSYDAGRAFAPILRCAISGLYITSAATLPVKNIKELVALARRHPNQVTYGTVGQGSVAHLARKCSTLPPASKRWRWLIKARRPCWWRRPRVRSAFPF